MTYYETLQVTENASDEVIHMAYKALAKKYHPDVFQGDLKLAEEKMKQINTAFEILSDKQKRAQYDSLLHTQKNTSKEYNQKNSKNKETTDTFIKNKRPFVSLKSKKALIVIITALVLLTIVAVAIVSNNKSNEISSVGIRTVTFPEKALADYVLTTWIMDGATEKSMIELMDKYGYEQGGGQLYIITRGEFIEEIEDWCFDPERKTGDYRIIENAYGYSLCYISSLNEK